MADRLREINGTNQRSSDGILTLVCTENAYQAKDEPRIFVWGGGGTGFQFIDHMHYACYCLHTSIPTNKYTTHTIIHVNMKYQ